MAQEVMEAAILGDPRAQLLCVLLSAKTGVSPHECAARIQELSK